MSVPDITEHVFAICTKMGHDPNLVHSIHITPEAVFFEVYMEPKQMGANGPLTLHETVPWRGVGDEEDLPGRS